MNQAKQVVMETEEQRVLRQEYEEIQAMLKQNRENRAATGKGVTCQLTPTAKGPVGFKINGLGIPKFFYKQQARVLLGEGEAAVALRKQILAWIEAHEVELTDKQ